MSDTEEPKKDKKKKKKKPDKKAGQGSSIVALGDKITIDSAQPLPHLDRGDVKAYAAKDKKRGVDLFALVCEPHITPRILAAPVYQSIANNRIAPLERRGIVHWPPAGAQRYVLVFQDVLGQPVWSHDKPVAVGLANDFILEKVLQPLVTILMDFRDRDFFHGGIRLMNLFDGGAANFEKLMLGPSIESPSSYMQPALYETIYRGMAQANARGKGRQAHDLYALGVVLAVMMRTKDPLEGLADHEIVLRKLEEGSYAAITGKDRFKGSVLELLRGLLHDDDDMRWTIDEVQEWMEGQRLSPKQAVPKKKSDRPITFDGQKHFYLSTLVASFVQNPTETKRLIDEGDLEQWLARSMGEEELFDSVQAAVDTVRAQGQGSGYQERLVSRVSMVLDPLAPIKYKKQAVLPEGIGVALCEAFVKKQDLNVFSEILGQSLPSAWIKGQYNVGLDPGIMGSTYEACARFLKKTSIGLGLERCAYQLNPESHCLSDKLVNYYPMNAQEILLALDDLSAKGMKPALFIDRHIAAFMSNQESRHIDDLFPQLNSKDYYKRVLANLRCFAIVQKREKMASLPGLGKAFLALMPALYERYHDRDLREELERKVEKHAMAGDLVKMLSAIDDPSVSKADFKAFKHSMAEYKYLLHEYEELVRRMQNKAVYGRGAGHRFAAIVSMGLASFIILVLTAINFF